MAVTRRQPLWVVLTFCGALAGVEAQAEPPNPRKFRDHSGEVDCVVFTPDGTHLLSGGEDKVVMLWDLATGKRVRSFRGHGKSVSEVAASATLVASASWDDTVRVWERETGKELHRFAGRPYLGGSLAFSPDGGLLVHGDPLGVAVRSMPEGGLVMTADLRREGYVSTAALAPEAHP